MKQIILPLLLFLGMSAGYAQFREVMPQPAALADHPAYGQLKTAYDESRWSETFELAIALSDRYAESGQLYFYAANALYYNKQYVPALQYYRATVALQPFEPVHLTAAVMGAMYAKEPKTVTEALNLLSFVPMDKGQQVQAEAQLQILLDNFVSYPEYATVRNALQQGMQQYRDQYAANMNFHKECVNTLMQFRGDKDLAWASLNKLKTKKKAGHYPAMLYDHIIGHIAAACIAGGEKGQALFSNLSAEFNATIADKRNHPLSAYLLYRQIVRYAAQVKDQEAIIAVSKVMLAELNASGIAPALSYEVLINLTNAYLKKNELNQAKEYAQALIKVIPEIKNQNAKIEAYNVAGVAISYTDNTVAARLFDEGIAYAKLAGVGEDVLTTNKAGFVDRKVTTSSNTEEASFVVAENKGVLFADQGRYEDAIPHLRHAKKVIEEEMAGAAADKIKGLLADYERVCNLLIGCIAHVKNGAAILPVIEDIKGYGLAESIAGSRKRATLKEIQAVLKADEALIYFIDISGNLYDGYYVPLLLTRDKVYSGFSFAKNSFLPEFYAAFNAEIGSIERDLARREFRNPVYTVYTSRSEARGQDLKKGEMGLLIEVYRRQLNPSAEALSNGTYNPDIAKAFGMAFYNMLLHVFEDALKGKRHLIFSLTGALNYLPFETLMTADKQYLVQQYDISYIPSGTVLAQLRQRKTRQYAKPVLAFGDARYSARTAQGYTLKSQTDVDRIALKVKESIAAGTNLDQAFATFSKTAATYLPGTKKEVTMIKTIVPGADIFLNEQMTEPEFKRLNAAGALNDYRIIHLASHAGVHPYIFDLSGIMFSVFPQPLDGEDGELVISEVAQLRMAPELVMLSACQTGLGKLVPGDGVAGLNHAFLMAGAHATITSLWNVGDYATSVLVERLYQKIFRENKPYVKALNEVKREFIGSEDPVLRLSLSWAPFIYTGK